MTRVYDASTTNSTVSAPGSSTAGNAFDVTVTALDAFGNTDTSYTGIVHFTSSDSQAVLPSNYTFVGGDGGVHTFTNGVTLKTAASQTVTGADTVTSSISGTTSTITATHASAPPYPVSPPVGSTTAGSAFNVTVTALDAYSNTDTGYTGIVHFTSSDSQAVLPSNYTFVGGDGGVHTFTKGVTLKTAASQTVTGADTVTSSISGTTSTITVNHASATHYTVSASVASSTAGNAFNVTVTALDAYSNTDTGYTGIVHFTSSDSQAVLPSNYTFVGGDAGVHTFTNRVTLKTAASQTVTGTDTVPSSISGTTSPIPLTHPSPPPSAVSASVASSTAGSAFNVAVTALDAYGNTDTSYTGIVHFTSSDSQAVLPSN